MLARYGDRNVRYLLGDVRNKTRLAWACQGADVIATPRP